MVKMGRNGSNGKFFIFKKFYLNFLKKHTHLFFLSSGEQRDLNGFQLNISEVGKLPKE